MKIAVDPRFERKDEKNSCLLICNLCACVLKTKEIVNEVSKHAVDQEDKGRHCRLGGESLSFAQQQHELGDFPSGVGRVSKERMLLVGWSSGRSGLEK